MPEAAPREVAFWCSTYSMSSQPRIGGHRSERGVGEGAAGLGEELRRRSPRRSSPVKTIEPTLKPYQPIHSSPAPSMVSVRLCGRMASLPKPMRLPSRSDQDQAGHTGVDVHRGAAGVVLGADPAADERVLGAAEDHVRHREVDDQRPERHEDHPGRELHPVRDRAADQRDGDDRERHLEHHVDVVCRWRRRRARTARTGRRRTCRRRSSPSTSRRRRRGCRRSPPRCRTSSSC